MNEDASVEIVDQIRVRVTDILLRHVGDLELRQDCGDLRPPEPRVLVVRHRHILLPVTATRRIQFLSVREEKMREEEKIEIEIEI